MGAPIQKAGAKPNKAARDLRIIELAAQDMSLRTISDKLATEGWKLGRMGVQRVVNGWLDELAEATLLTTRRMRAKMLDRHSRVIREAEAAWERSKTPAVKTSVKQKKTAGADGGPDKVEVFKQEEHQVGDPRFLAIIQQGEQARAKLLGLEAPQKHALTDTSGEEDLGALFAARDAASLAKLCRAAADIYEAEIVSVMDAPPLLPPAQDAAPKGNGHAAAGNGHGGNGHAGA